MSKSSSSAVTPPRAGSRKYFGAILVGYYETSGKEAVPAVLRFAGKVGTGFNSKTLAKLYRQFQQERPKVIARSWIFRQSRMENGRKALAPRKCASAPGSIQSWSPK